MAVSWLARRLRAYRNRRPAQQRGQTVVEFALVLLPMLITFLTVIEFSFLLFSWVLIEHSAREGLRTAITGADIAGTSPATGANRITAINTAVNSATAGLPRAGTDITVSVSSWANNPFASTETANDPGNACWAVQVQVVYNYRPISPFFTAITLNLPLTAHERGLNEQFTGCGT